MSMPIITRSAQPILVKHAGATRRVVVFADRSSVVKAVGNVLVIGAFECVCFCS